VLSSGSLVKSSTTETPAATAEKTKTSQQLSLVRCVFSDSPPFVSRAFPCVFPEGEAVKGAKRSAAELCTRPVTKVREDGPDAAR
jgi:hypothetical protein